MAYRDLSLWLDTVPDDLTPRPPLPGDTSVDVAIVGGGYTGLWTAYYLLRADPSLRVAVVEAEIAGFGASGRNGGWASALFAGSRAATARRHGRDAAVALQRAMIDSIDELAKVCVDEDIDCHFHRGGGLVLATKPVHVERLRSGVAEEHQWGFGPDDYRWLDAGEARGRVAAGTVLGGAYTPHCARIHPARLARGLAHAVERRGGGIYERTPALTIESGRVTTPHGTVRADVVVRGTEAWTARLPGLRRRVIPVYSLMIATEPLPDDTWNRLGWAEAETLTDGRRLIIYAQRTADGRIAFGGRGAPYHFGSRIRPGYDLEPFVFADLEAALRGLLPAIGDALITHRWGGPLGVPRDWYSSVGFDRQTGLAWAGGYVGDGVTTTNLAGRTIADLVLDRKSTLVELPWVNHHSRSWEPEPLRWLGINAGLRLTALADRREERSGRVAPVLDRALRVLLGR